MRATFTREGDQGKCDWQDIHEQSRNEVKRRARYTIHIEEEGEIKVLYEMFGDNVVYAINGINVLLHQ